jgi:predicted GNAT family acetyltransferase
MTVQHRKSGAKGLFYVEYEGDIAAEMVYSLPSGDQMLIEHTEVSEVLSGKNIGYELVHAGVEYARQHGMKINPVCSFARAILSKKPEWKDVLAA